MDGFDSDAALPDADLPAADMQSSVGIPSNRLEIGDALGDVWLVRMYPFQKAE